MSHRERATIFGKEIARSKIEWRWLKKSRLIQYILCTESKKPFLEVELWEVPLRPKNLIAAFERVLPHFDTSLKQISRWAWCQYSRRKACGRDFVKSGGPRVRKYDTRTCCAPAGKEDKHKMCKDHVDDGHCAASLCKSTDYPSSVKQIEVQNLLFIF